MNNYQSFFKTSNLIIFIILWILTPPSDGLTNPQNSLEQRVKKYTLSGNYEGAISLLESFIKKTRDIDGKRKSLAEAYYFLARIYTNVGLEAKAIRNLKNAYQSFPALNIDQREEDLYFKEIVILIKNMIISQELKKNLKKDSSLKVENKKPEDIKKKSTDLSPTNKMKIPGKIKFGELVPSTQLDKKVEGKKIIFPLIKNQVGSRKIISRIKIIISVLINTKGRVEDYRIIKVIPEIPDMDKKIESVVNSWRFTIPTKDKIKVKTWITFPLRKTF